MEPRNPTEEDPSQPPRLELLTSGRSSGFGGLIKDTDNQATECESEAEYQES